MDFRLKRRCLAEIYGGYMTDCHTTISQKSRTCFLDSQITPDASLHVLSSHILSAHIIRR